MMFNTIIGSKNESMKLLNDPVQLKKKQVDICTMIMKQLNRTRNPIKPDEQYIQSAQDQFKWNRVRLIYINI